MDWGRAKTILIVVFLILNTFLLVNIGINKLSRNDSRQAIENAVAILKNKGVKVECEIPTQDKAMGKLELHDQAYFDLKKTYLKLIGDSVDISDEANEAQNLVNGTKKLDIKSNTDFTYLDSDSQEKWNINKLETAEKQAQKFLKSIGINYSEFEVDVKEQISKEDWKIVFVHKYKGYYIFDNKISIVLGSSGVKELEYHVKKPELIEEDTLKIIAAYKVLLTNYGNSPGVVITGIDIGYNINKLDKSMKDYKGIPVWRVKNISGSVRFFDAYTGVEK